MKFVMTQAVLCPEGMNLLTAIAEIWVADNPDPNQYLPEMQDADALIVRLASCDGQVVAQSPRLKVIGRTGVCYDNVDVEAATRYGIPVVITPGANNRSVAEHTVAMMFALSQNLYEAQAEMCAGNWEIRGAGKAFELSGKKIGFIGLGALGREVLSICRGIGMAAAAYDPYLKTRDDRRIRCPLLRRLPGNAERMRSNLSPCAACSGNKKHDWSCGIKPDEKNCPINQLLKRRNRE